MERPYRSRVLHNGLVGAYSPGRHFSYLPRKLQLDRSEAYIAWFGFAPAAESYLTRKLQIQKRIPKADLLAGFGEHHLVDLSLLNRQIDYLAPRARKRSDTMPAWQRNGIKALGRLAKPWAKFRRKFM